MWQIFSSSGPRISFAVSPFESVSAFGKRPEAGRGAPVPWPRRTLFVSLPDTFESPREQKARGSGCSWLELELLKLACARRSGPGADCGLLCAPRCCLGPTASVRSHGVGGRVCRRQLPVSARGAGRSIDGAPDLTCRRRNGRSTQRSRCRRTAYSRADCRSVVISGAAQITVAGPATRASAARTSLHVIPSGR